MRVVGHLRLMMVLAVFACLSADAATWFNWKGGAGTLAFATTNSVVRGAFRVDGGTIDVSDEMFEAAANACLPIIKASDVDGVAAALSDRLMYSLREADDF